MIQNGFFKNRLPKWVCIIIHIIISPGIVIFDEIYLAVKMYPLIRAVSKLRIKRNNLLGQVVNRAMPIQFPSTPPTFTDLTETSQVLYKQYYNSILMQQKAKLNFMAREASIQLIYQNAIVINDFFYPPLRELDYSAWSRPYAIWVASQLIQILSVVLSGYSTFSPTIEDLKIKSFMRHKKRAGYLSYLVKIVQVLTHITMATGIVYLSRSDTLKIVHMIYLDNI